MRSSVDISEDNIRLLSTLDLDEVVEIVADLVARLTQAQAIAVLVWDEDLESFGDHHLYGPKRKEFSKFTQAFADAYEDFAAVIKEVDPDDVDVRLPPELKPVVCYRIAEESHHCACVLIAGVDDLDYAELIDELSRYPLKSAVHNAWEFRELKRENERLRGQYEELEESIRSLEEQTRRLIHDVMAKEELRTKQVDRERLVYAISNAVRSSLKINEVLKTAVNQIGQTYRVSHCLLLRRPEGQENIAVFEYHNPLEQPIHDLFLTDSGTEFMRAAMKHEAPQVLGDPDTDSQGLYDRDFLKKIGLRSGLIVPLIIRDRSLGVIFIQHCKEAVEWSIDQTALLGSLADQLSVAIENAELHEERERQARTDGLTGVANRRHFTEVFELEFERARRYDQPLSLVVADLDYLKRINDAYGHQAGDEAIKTIARVIRQSSRAIDLAARYGGEEFCLLLPNTDLEMAKQIAERLRKLINETPVEGPGAISASIGVASYPNHAGNPEVLFQQADLALYKAKQSGRNRVCVAPAADERASYEI